MKNNLRLFLYAIVFFCGISSCYSQNPYTHIEGDSTVDKPHFDTVNISKTDTSPIVLDSAKALDVRKHSARKAALFSTVLPGLGQAYNKKYWKIPIVYAGFGAMTYFFTFNNSRYNKFKEALILRNDGDSSTVDQYVKQFNDQSLVEYKDYYRRNRDLSAIGFVLIYVLNIVDANVDANLYYFDVSDDLSLQWSPVVIPSSTFASGISLKLRF